MKRLHRSFRVSVLLGLLFCACGLRADTPSATPTITPSPTMTPTVTPGTGSYSYVVENAQLTPYTTPFVVPGNTGNILLISYTSPADFSGALAFQLPSDFCSAQGIYPNQNTFYADNDPDLTYTYPTPTTNPCSVTVSTSTGDISAGVSVVFSYGENATGGYTFAVAATTTAGEENVQIWANGGLVPAPSPILVWTATISPTSTPSPTTSPSFTVSPTPTDTPNWTATPTSTPTVSCTNTPVGPVRAAIGFYTYPNPFDLRQQSCVTVRFPPTSEPVEITIFSLTGNPVCTLPGTAIQNFLGVAQWCGTDDYGRTVSGGLYFVRLKTPSQTWVHKMTVFH